MSSRKNKKKRSIRNIILNIMSTLLILLALALIFNSSIRNMIIVWNTNKCLRPDHRGDLLPR